MTLVFHRLKDTDRNVNATLYFGNVDPRALDILMYELFVQFAPVRNIHMPKDRILKSHQGFGFVEFTSVADADYTLLVLAGISLHGKTLKLKKNDLHRPAPSTGLLADVPSSAFTLLHPNYVDVGARLFVSNLSPLVDEQFLRDTFSRFGTLIMAPVIVRDSATGESKGHAILVFDDFASSDKVIDSLNGSTLMNQRVSIEYAYKNTANPSHTKLRARHGDVIERRLAESAKKNKVNVVKRAPRPKKAAKK